MLALSFALRELRGLWHGRGNGFRLFILCLWLGVMAIAAVQSLQMAVAAGLRADGRAILGGDISIRSIYRPLDDRLLGELRQQGQVSQVIELRAMAVAEAGAADKSGLVEIKAVDDAYPLYGQVETEPAGNWRTKLALENGHYGALLDPVLVDRLGLRLGDNFTIGDAVLEYRGSLIKEPDRAGGGTFTLAPRVMLSPAALQATGIAGFGSLTYHHTRVKLPPSLAAAEFAAQLEAAYPKPSWRLRTFENASPQLQNFISRLGLFMTLVGLTTLLVGGVGLASTVRAFMLARQSAIATLKMLGAPSRLVFQSYLLQMMVLAFFASLAGALAGMGLPFMVTGLLADILPVRIIPTFYPQAFLLAILAGLASALLFAAWPLGVAARVPAITIFRPRLQFTARLPIAMAWPWLGGGLLVLTGLVFYLAQQWWLAVGFLLGSAIAFALFLGLALLLMRLLRLLPRPRQPLLRLALANLYRANAATPILMLALGLGLTVLVAVGSVQGNFSRQLQERMPAAAPAFFFIDIQPSQRDDFIATAGAVEGVTDINLVPQIRGRIELVNDLPAEQALRDERESWLLRSDRGFSYAARPQPYDRLLAGSWWPENYSGEPMVSVVDDVARAFGVGVGDKITINVLGSSVAARIANIRDVDWTTLSINFALVFTPNALENLPHSFLATIRVPAAGEATLQRQLVRQFPNVSAIRVKDALDMVNQVMGNITLAVQATALLALLAGMLVLGGAIAATQQQRVYDAVVLKVLGARRRAVMAGYLLEYLLLGALAAALAALLGNVAAWLVLTQVMDQQYQFLPLLALAILGLALVAALSLGAVASYRALGQKAAPILRNS